MRHYFVPVITFLLLEKAIGLPVVSKDSASGMAGSLGTSKRDTNWYTDSASGVAESLTKRDKDTNWYTDSASGVAESLTKRDKDTNWYTDSASGVVGSLEQRGKETNWYTDSASGVAGSLDSRKPDTDTNWYSDSASGVAQSLNKNKRDGMTTKDKEKYEKSLREWIYNDMRAEPLRKSSERGKAFFEFTPKPRHDIVDRYHVPVELQERFNASQSDAEQVSILNYYLMVTDREPKSAKELGFTPTFTAPGLTEKNEVGYGYALAGQHQYHCLNFVADAIDIGKNNLNDFYLKHTIHCLGLMKWLAPQLTMKQPTSYLLPAANERILNNYPQTGQA
ncbi:hypothetical protein RRF57_012635 [Xylaria bambusicola]|uniref:Uncharacterized protein n=1 Tax=Xylaria bambusicola TaxID=326684 RepID=A0AAN7ZEY8_9PEZI